MRVSSGRAGGIFFWKREGQTQKQQQAAESKERVEERNGANENTVSRVDNFIEKTRRAKEKSLMGHTWFRARETSLGVVRREEVSRRERRGAGWLLLFQ